MKTESKTALAAAETKIVRATVDGNLSDKFLDSNEVAEEEVQDEFY